MRFIESYVNEHINFWEKLSEKGEKLSSCAKRKDGVRVIFDKNTGLYWEVKSDNENDVNYCEDKYNFEEAKDIYIEKLNNERYGGYSDWRIPNKDELRSIVDYGIDEIAVDINVFENCKIGDYWTKNTYNMQPYFGWVIYFGFGSAIAKSKNNKRYVIACRGGYSKLFGEANSKRFVDNGDGTVIDTATDIMWQSGENERMNLFEAQKFCSEMTLGGYTDWKLPNIKELNTILNLGYTDNWWYFKDVFKAEGLNPPLLHYFSSSQFKNNYAWVTNFCFGYDGYYGEKSATLLFRASRNIKKENEDINIFRLPHTGEDTVYDVEGNITECEEYYGLDATVIINPLEFEVISPQKAVKDINTGLIWEINGSGGQRFTWKEAKEYIDCLNEKCFGGFSDWRLPSREELRTIVKYDDSIPAIDKDYFTDAKAEFYWSRNEHKGNGNLAWGIYFGYGCAIGYPKTEKMCVRAVCGGYDKDAFDASEKDRFIDNNNGTVTDLKLGLMWMKEETPLLTMKEALKYCSEMKLAGFSDWRLPNMKELATLVNIKQGSDKWYMKEFFPNTNTKPQGFYMSSTTFDATFGWGCNFQFGFDGYYADRKNGKYPFRPVRRI